MYDIIKLVSLTKQILVVETKTQRIGAGYCAETGGARKNRISRDPRRAAPCLPPWGRWHGAAVTKEAAPAAARHPPQMGQCRQPNVERQTKGFRKQTVVCHCEPAPQRWCGNPHPPSLAPCERGAGERSETEGSLASPWGEAVTLA